MTDTAQTNIESAPLAFLTGGGETGERRCRTTEAGFNHHLVKPPDPQAVEGLLAALPKRR